MKQIISASRRTDIPAHYLDWLIEHLEQGFVDVQNPFYPSQYSHILLNPENVHTLVLWSKDYTNFLTKTENFDDYHLYFHFTINGDFPNLEPGLRTSLQDRIKQFRILSEIFGKDRVNWRFDPIVHWKIQDKEYSNLSDFESLLIEMSNIDCSKCTISYATWYQKSENRARQRNFPFIKLNLEQQVENANQVALMAKKYNIDLFACCNPHLTVVENIQNACCIDGVTLTSLKGERASYAKATGQRNSCMCTTSKDIGSYLNQPCDHNCIYCYANTKKSI